MKKILFVCTGNTCRSPMAEAIFNRLSENTEFSASSCGIYADGFSCISENAKEALLENGINFNHISVPVSIDKVRDADYIIGITSKHADILTDCFPEFSYKIFAMPTDILDPFGGNINIYKQCRDEIEESVKEIIKVLTGKNNG